jgi:hypothetical protein
MKKLLLVSLCFLMLSITQVFAQSPTITGTVTSKDDGLPIPGVVVRVKGAPTSTSTDPNGRYSIKGFLLYRFCNPRDRSQRIKNSERGVGHQCKGFD